MTRLRTLALSYSEDQPRDDLGRFGSGGGGGGAVSPDTVVAYPGAPRLGIPADPDYRGQGYGTRVGAAERLAQYRDEASSFLGAPGSNWEFQAVQGNRDVALSQMRDGWMDGAETPESGLLQTCMKQGDGMVWTGGLPALEPTRAAMGVTQEMYATTQSSLASGPETFTLYRGLKTDVTTRNVLESWSADYEGAARFDGDSILKAEVPREAIFMDLREASIFEQEMVVLGEQLPDGAITVLPGTGDTGVGFDPRNRLP